MKNVFFGLGFQFDDGTRPGVGLNRDGVVVEVHKNEAGHALYARTGSLDQTTVTWNDTGSKRKSYSDGTDPACALNAKNVILEAHSDKKKLHSMVGTISGTSISWGSAQTFEKDGLEPGVAMIDSGLAVTVFQQRSSSAVRYRVGRVDAAGKKCSFKSAYTFGDGEAAKVAMNNSGQVVVVWRTEDGSLRARVGSVDRNEETITFGPASRFGDGITPAVALTDDGFVTVVHKSSKGSELQQRTGNLNDARTGVDWIDLWPRYYDNGTDPVCAAAGGMTIEMHRGETGTRLWYSTSIITDRANWMSQRIGQLGQRKLKELALPASHDSGMYTRSGLSDLAQTQRLSVYGQLADAGIRYFDLRPSYNKKKDEFHVHHGIVDGPDLEQVLAGMRRFAEEGHNEVWIIDFSHFENFGEIEDRTVYDKFTEAIVAEIGPYLYKNKPAGLRLAEIPLGDYLAKGPKIIVSVARDWARLYPKPGFWVFRDSNSDHAAEGDLRVFDQYTNTLFYDAMRKDQIKKYETYTGKCDPKTDEICDLFLFSFTITPVTDVWDLSKEALRSLGSVVKDLKIPNDYGQHLNLIYVDYCEYSRVSDVAFFANKAPHADAVVAVPKAKKAAPPASAKLPVKAKTKAAGSKKPAAKPKSKRPTA